MPRNTRRKFEKNIIINLKCSFSLQFKLQCEDKKAIRRKILRELIVIYISTKATKSLGILEILFPRNQELAETERKSFSREFSRDNK